MWLESPQQPGQVDIIDILEYLRLRNTFIYLLTYLQIHMAAVYGSIWRQVLHT